MSYVQAQQQSSDLNFNSHGSHSNHSNHSKNNSSRKLFTAEEKHQRDLFSGDLGIPIVGMSRVGSVINTFENLAIQQQLKLAKEQDRMMANSKYLFHLANETTIAPSLSTVGNNNNNNNSNSNCNNNNDNNNNRSTNNNTHYYNWYNNGVTTITTKTGTSCSRKIQQLKRKTYNSQRHKLIQQLFQQQQYLQKRQEQIHSLPNRSSLTTIDEQKHSSLVNTEVYYKNINNDYRRNYFTTMQTVVATPKPKPNTKPMPMPIPMPTSKPKPKSKLNTKRKTKLKNQSSSTSSVTALSEETQIVNKAFEDILANYTDLEIDDTIDEDDKNEKYTDEKLSENERNIKKKIQKKYQAPLPPRPSSTISSYNPILHSLMDHNSEQIQNERISSKSRRFAELFHKWKIFSIKPFSNRKKKRSNDQLQLLRNTFNYTNQSVQKQFNDRIKQLEESEQKQKQDNFLHGSTLSQSFVHRLKGSSNFWELPLTQSILKRNCDRNF